MKDLLKEIKIILLEKYDEDCLCDCEKVCRYCSAAYAIYELIKRDKK